MMFCSVDFLEFTYPAAQEPSWRQKVERWYQMDAASYGFCELAVRAPSQRAPDCMFLTSPAGCKEMDLQFVKTGALNPSKFVYTLPSIRSSALLQVLEWHGPLLCLQNGDSSLAAGLCEAALLANSGKSSWLLGYLQTSSNLAFRLVIGAEGPFALERADNSDETPIKDSALLEWLRTPNKSAPGLGSGWNLKLRRSM